MILDSWKIFNEEPPNSSSLIILQTINQDFNLRNYYLRIMYWFELQDLMFFIKSLKEPPDNLNISDYVSFVSGNTRPCCINIQTFHLLQILPSLLFHKNRSTLELNPKWYIFYLKFFANNQISIIHLFSTPFSIVSNNVYAHFIYFVLVLGAFQYNLYLY